MRLKLFRTAEWLRTDISSRNKCGKCSAVCLCGRLQDTFFFFFFFACLCYVCLCAFQVAVSAAAAETSTEAFCFLILSVFANMLCDVYALFYAQFNVFLRLPVFLCLPVFCRFAYILEQYTEQYGIKYHKNSIKKSLFTSDRLSQQVAMKRNIFVRLFSYLPRFAAIIVYNLNVERENNLTDTVYCLVLGISRSFPAFLPQFLQFLPQYYRRVSSVLRCCRTVCGYSG